MTSNISHGIDYHNIKLVEHQKNLYNIIIDKIVPISEEQKVFGINSKDDIKKLGLLIIEPREHEWLKGVLLNMAHVYGGKNCPLFIVHGNKNETFVKNILHDWVNVNYLKLDIDNLNISQYNNLLTNPSFWSNFHTKHILLFQTDSFIRKEIPEIFFIYDYIGAPWPWFPVKNNRRVGNGGFSLRNVQAMIKICSNHEYDEEKYIAEDIFFSTYVDIDMCPPIMLASLFAVEHIYSNDPVGLHQVYRFQNFDDIFGLMNNKAGVPQLQYK